MCVTDRRFPALASIPAAPTDFSTSMSIDGRAGPLSISGIPPRGSTATVAAAVWLPVSPREGFTSWASSSSWAMAAAPGFRSGSAAHAQLVAADHGCMSPWVGASLVPPRATRGSKGDVGSCCGSLVVLSSTPPSHSFRSLPLAVSVGVAVRVAVAVLQFSAILLLLLSCHDHCGCFSSVVCGLLVAARAFCLPLDSQSRWYRLVGADQLRMSVRDDCHVTKGLACNEAAKLTKVRVGSEPVG